MSDSFLAACRATINEVSLLEQLILERKREREDLLDSLDSVLGEGSIIRVNGKTCYKGYSPRLPPTTLAWLSDGIVQASLKALIYWEPLAGITIVSAVEVKP